MQKILPGVSFLVSCINKKLNEAGKLNEFVKKLAYWKLLH